MHPPANNQNFDLAVHEGYSSNIIIYPAGQHRELYKSLKRSEEVTIGLFSIAYMTFIGWG